MAKRKSVRDLTPTERDNFIQSIWALKRERTGTDGLSTYDRFVVWHATSMARSTPWPDDLGTTLIDRFLQQADPNQFFSIRNSAHRGPAFLPWHREFLRRLEKELQRVSGNPDMGVPYWDWEADGERPLAEQLDVSSRAVWQMVGGDGTSSLGFMVTTGPFAFDPSRLRDPTVFNDPNVWLTVDRLGRRVGFLQRALGGAVFRRDASGAFVIDPATGERIVDRNMLLPRRSEVDDIVKNVSDYDRPNWDENSALLSFRNLLEGWAGTGLHNRVHVWVGGSMGPGTSPNDPVFFLHHCNIDRIWALWQEAHPTAEYRPQSGGPIGHNLKDPMFPWDGKELPDVVTPEDLLQLGDVEYEPPPPPQPPGP
jgi:tyrosinase